jgi:hypothetical protein
VIETEREPAHADRSKLHGRILDWTEAGLWIVLLVVGSLVALTVLREGEARIGPRAAARPAPGGLIEAEDLPVVAKSRDFSFWLQPSEGFSGGKWSKDGHMFALGTRQGDWIELRLPDQEPGLYPIELFMTKAADYGMIAAVINEVQLGTFDLLSLRKVVPTGPLSLGDVQLAARKNVLRLEVVGKNPNAAAPFYQFGVDGVRIGKRASAASGETSDRAIPKAESNAEGDSSDGG